MNGRGSSLLWTVAPGTSARLARRTAGQEPRGRRETRCSLLSLQIILFFLFKDNIEMDTADGDNTRSTQSCQTTRLLKKRARADGGPSAQRAPTAQPAPATQKHSGVTKHRSLYPCDQSSPSFPVQRPFRHREYHELEERSGPVTAVLRLYPGNY